MRKGFITNEDKLTKNKILSLIKDKELNGEFFDKSKIEDYETMDASQFYSILIRYYLVASAFNKKITLQRGRKLFLLKSSF